MLSTTSSTPASAIASASIWRFASALPRLVHVRLLRHPRLVVVGLGDGVDAAIPEQRAAAPLLVLERRLLRLQRFDERGDVGGVGLPEQRHGRGDRKGGSLSGPEDAAGAAGLRRRRGERAGRRAGTNAARR